jgi:O-Antigen ligase
VVTRINLDRSTPNLIVELLRQNTSYLIFSCLVFPISLKLSLICFIYFLVSRILAFNSNCYSVFFKVGFGIIIAIAIFKIYTESRSHFYPVSIYDYLLLLITVSIIKLYPLKTNSIYQLCWAINSSLIIVFLAHLLSLDVTVRSDWGFENPNWLGLYCSMCLPLNLCIFINQLQKSEFEVAINNVIGKISSFIPILSLLFNFIMMLSSGSRSSLYTSLFVAILILSKVFIKYRWCYLDQRKLIVLSTIFLILSSLIYKLLILKFVFLNRFLDIGNSTNIYRLKVYKCHLELGWQKPWWGWGINNASTLCEQKLKAGYGGVNHAHNFIIQLFADHGLIVTLFSLIIIIYFIIIPAIKLIINYSFDSEESTIYLGICLSSLSILLVSLFQSGFYHYPLFPLWLGLLWGCQLSLAKKYQF